MKQTNNLLNETIISDQEESASNFEKVVEMLKENILYHQQAVSMKTLTEVYNLIQADDKRYRHKLKDRKRRGIFVFFPFDCVKYVKIRVCSEPYFPL